MLDVQDNGIGLENAPPPSKGGGYGLTAMRQRVSQVGGSLTVESDPFNRWLNLNLLNKRIYETNSRSSRG